MRNIFALACAALAGLSAYAADYSATIPSGDPLEQWHFNLKDGQALDPNTASGQGIFLWNDGAALPALPSLEDSFSVTADTITFRAWPWDFGGSNTIYAKNFDITAKEGRFFANGNDVPTYLEVAENFKVDSSARGIVFGTAFAFGPADSGSVSFQRITIGGNLEVIFAEGEMSAENVFFVTSPIENYAYSAEDPFMIIGGQAKFSAGNRWMANNGKDGNDMTKPADMWAQVGGIDAKDLRVSANNPSTRSFNIVFKSDGKTPFTGGVWTGAMTSFWGSDTATASITMDGGADGGMQTVRFVDYAFGEHDQVMAKQTLNMVSGKLALGTQEKTKFTEINMMGGKLYVDDGSYEGFMTDVLNLDGGQLIFDAWNGGSESIVVDVINGSLTDIVINLDSDYFYVGMDVDDISFDMFRGTTSADWDALSRSVKFMLDGKEVTVDGHVFSLQYGNGVLTLSGVISDVPEPAAIAAALGAFALAFAARRRRK